MKAILEETVQIRSGMVGPQNRLCLYQLPILFQNISTDHAAMLGVGAEELREKSGAYWVITKTRVRIFELPRYAEKLTLRTWPNPPKSIICERNCELTAGDRVYAQARTQWAMLDCETHRPRRISGTCYPDDLEYEEKVLVPDASGRMRSKLDEAYKVCERTVYPSDIDLAEHTNNAASCRMLLDLLPLSVQNAFCPQQWEIQYFAESHEGNVLSLYRMDDETGVHLLAAKEDGTPAVGMRIIRI